MDGELRKYSHKGIGCDDSKFIPVVDRSGERRSQEKYFVNLKQGQ